RLATGGVLLIAAGGGAYLAIRKVPSADEELEGMLSQVPSAPRLALAIILDFGVVATIVSGADRIIRAAAHIRAFGLHDFLVLIAAVVGGVAVGRGGGGAVGEGAAVDAGIPAAGGPVAALGARGADRARVAGVRGRGEGPGDRLARHRGHGHLRRRRARAGRARHHREDHHRRHHRGGAEGGAQGADAAGPRV